MASGAEVTNPSANCLSRLLWNYDADTAGHRHLHATEIQSGYAERLGAMFDLVQYFIAMDGHA